MIVDSAYGRMQVQLVGSTTAAAPQPEFAHPLEDVSYVRESHVVYTPVNDRAYAPAMVDPGTSGDCYAPVVVGDSTVSSGGQREPELHIGKFFCACLGVGELFWLFVNFCELNFFSYKLYFSIGFILETLICDHSHMEIIVNYQFLVPTGQNKLSYL